MKEGKGLTAHADGAGCAAGSAGGHGIEAAGVKRRATEQAADGEPGADQRAVGADGLGGVVRAGGVEAAAAGGAEDRREHG